MSLNRGSGVNYIWLEKKEQKAISVIENWIEQSNGQIYGSVSGGKDSLVMAHLIHQVDSNCPFVWVNQGPMAEWSDCIELLDYFRASGWQIVELCPPRSLLKLYKDFGLPLEGQMNTKLDKLINQQLIYNPLDEYQELNGIQGYAWGIRQGESKGRAKFMRSHGELYQRKNGLWICSPIGFWKTEDIWHYIDRHSLFYPAMYDRDRMTVRNGPAIGTTGVNRGRLAELRINHNELFEEFATMFPEIRNYA